MKEDVQMVKKHKKYRPSLSVIRGGNMKRLPSKFLKLKRLIMPITIKS